MTNCKKDIRVSFDGFYKGFNINDNYLLDTLNKKYNVIISDKPDYIFCSIHKKKYQYCKYDGIRIMIQGEPYIPDFNLVDYAIGTYNLNLYDRYYCLPCGIESLINKTSRFIELSNRKNYSLGSDFLRTKKSFAGFVASHESENSIRGDFYKELSKYKEICSAGVYLNNMEDGYCVDFHDDSKINFLSRCKFCLCFESTKHTGFISEKIEDAFISNCIPIYFGSETVFEIYNKDAFIYCSSRDDFDKTIEKVKKIDENDDLYLKIINSEKFNKEFNANKYLDGLEKFLYHIFDQDYNKAKRRLNYAAPKQHNDYLLSINNLVNNKYFVFINNIYKKITGNNLIK